MSVGILLPKRDFLVGGVILYFSGISWPKAAVAVEAAFNAKKARRGLKSRPKMGGIKPRKALRYGSVIAKTG